MELYGTFHCTNVQKEKPRLCSVAVHYWQYYRATEYFPSTQQRISVESSFFIIWAKLVRISPTIARIQASEIPLAAFAS